MSAVSYATRRGELETYFDRTAVDAWKRLTSDAPVGRIRATVRAGREAMRAKLLSWLPADMKGLRLLDAGCGTGALAVEAARRGADVVAIDISPTLVEIAKQRTPGDLGGGHLTFAVGDMLNPPGGRFDHVVAMDSLIHYEGRDIARALASFAARADRSIVFTIAPRTPALTLMHAVGGLFPRADRAPAIEPISPGALRRLMRDESGLRAWGLERAHRINSGFYLCHALEATPS
jgi:magnesium-protoporphyrin O-methyltransferase